MDAEGNCKPTWLFLTLECTDASMTALPACFVTLLGTAFTVEGIKWERSPILYLARQLCYSGRTASGHGGYRWRGELLRQEFPHPPALHGCCLPAHSLPPAPRGDEEGHFWSYGFMWWHPMSDSC